MLLWLQKTVSEHEKQVKKIASAPFFSCVSKGKDDDDDDGATGKEERENTRKKIPARHFLL